MWKETESDVFSAELVKTRSRVQACCLVQSDPPRAPFVCSAWLSEGHPRSFLFSSTQLLLLKGDCLTCLHSHPFVCELGRHPLICLRRRSQQPSQICVMLFFDVIPVTLLYRVSPDVTGRSHWAPVSLGHLLTLKRMRFSVSCLGA